MNTPILDATGLRGRTLADLHDIARQLKIPSYRKFHKLDLVEEILKMQHERPRSHAEEHVSPPAPPPPPPAPVEVHPPVHHAAEPPPRLPAPVEAVTIERAVEPGQLPMLIPAVAPEPAVVAVGGGGEREAPQPGMRPSEIDSSRLVANREAREYQSKVMSSAGGYPNSKRGRNPQHPQNRNKQVHDRRDRGPGQRPGGDHRMGVESVHSRPPMFKPVPADALPADGYDGGAGNAAGGPDLLQGRPVKPYHGRPYQQDPSGAPVATGLLEVLPEGYGFLRVKGYLPSPDDVYVSQTQIRRFGLWTGDIVNGPLRPPKEGEKYHSLIRVDTINDMKPEQLLRRAHFDDLVPIFPNDQLQMETVTENITGRLIDIFCPFGRGQRAMIVSPPKAGKTMMLKSIANSVASNHPEVYLIALLIDERPEEVTDMQRSVKGEVASSTFDELPENHVRVAELVMEKAKRMVEMGKDVVILLDSLTRMARAFNLIVPPSGRTLSGGLDPTAMHRPKRFFGAARNIEGGGSLSIIATALVETGSRMDDVIFEEFKGTGNSELRLDRRLSDRRIFPAIDVKLSGTRKEELLLAPEVLRKEHFLRKTLDAGENAEVTEFLVERLLRSQGNREFLASIVSEPDRGRHAE